MSIFSHATCSIDASPLIRQRDSTNKISFKEWRRLERLAPGVFIFHSYEYIFLLSYFFLFAYMLLLSFADKLINTVQSTCFHTSGIMKPSSPISSTKHVYETSGETPSPNKNPGIWLVKCIAQMYFIVLI